MGPNKMDNTLGSGFAIDRVENGSDSFCRLATDNHVVGSVSSDARVNLQDGKSYPFEVELRDVANDIAIVKVKGVPSEFCQPIAVENEPLPLKQGESVLKIGARDGGPNSTVGQVETYFRRSQADGLPLLPGENAARPMLSVQTNDRNSHGGDSGGPMLGLSGKAIAIMDAEGPGVIAGTPSNFLYDDLQKVRAKDSKREF
jgi:S1-C subfamily serine protease